MEQNGVTSQTEVFEKSYTDFILHLVDDAELGAAYNGELNRIAFQLFHSENLLGVIKTGLNNAILSDQGPAQALQHWFITRGYAVGTEECAKILAHQAETVFNGYVSPVMNFLQQMAMGFARGGMAGFTPSPATGGFSQPTGYGGPGYGRGGVDETSSAPTGYGGPGYGQH